MRGRHCSPLTRSGGWRGGGEGPRALTLREGEIAAAETSCVLPLFFDVDNEVSHCERLRIALTSGFGLISLAFLSFFFFFPTACTDFSSCCADRLTCLVDAVELVCHARGEEDLLQAQQKQKVPTGGARKRGKIELCKPSLHPLWQEQGRRESA